MGDFKEGYYLGKNLPSDDPFVVERRFGQAPNKYPTEVRDPEKFRNVMEEYHSVMSMFATNLMRVMARTLDLEEDFFDRFCDHPVAVLRLLHYPPQDPNTVETERGEYLEKDQKPLSMIYADSFVQVSVPIPTLARSPFFFKTTSADYRFGTTPHLNGSM